MSGINFRKIVALLTAAALMTLPPAEAAEFSYFRLKSPTGQLPNAPLPPPEQNHIALSFAGASTGTVDQYFSSTAQVTGSTGTVSFAVASGGLPAGIALDSSSGAISGIPTTAGISTTTIVAFDTGTGTSASAQLSLVINPSFGISGIASGFATVGQTYSAQFSGFGGTAPYSFRTSSAIPSGLTLDGAGLLSGIPSRSGSYPSISITGQDAAGRTAQSMSFGITVSDPLSIFWTASTGRFGDGYSTTPTVVGGRSSFSFALSGALPEGLTFSSISGTISGTPWNAGDFPVIIAVVDQDGRTSNTGSQTISILPSEAQRPLTISGTPATSGQIGVAYSASFSAVGGAGSGYNFDLAGGPLPDGLSLSPDGKIAGSPTTTGTYPGIQVRVTDDAANTALSNLFSIIVTAAPELMISGNPDPNAQIGKQYSTNFTAFDGSGMGYTFTSLGAPLPPGLTLVATSQAQATISGTPAYVGTYSGLQIRVTDSAGHVADSSVFSITVGPLAGPALVLVAPTTTHAAINVPFQSAVSAKGGSGSGYSFSIASGSLPVGLTLASDGVISGRPTTAQTASFTVLVTDAAGDTAQGTFSLTIDPQLEFEGAPGAASQGAAYQFNLRGLTSGGRQPFTYSLISGSLPIGMTLDPAGLISALGVSGSGATAVIKASDADGQAVAATLNFAVSPANATITPQLSKVVNGMLALRSGTVLSGTATTNLNNPQWTFSQVPASPSFAPSIDNGTFTATVPVVDSPTQVTITAQASNPYASATAQSFTVNVLPQLSVAAAANSPLDGVVGAPFSYGPYTASGIVGTPEFRLANLYTDGLPNGAFDVSTACPGLSLNSTTGIISGVPAASCAAELYMFLTDNYDGATVTYGSQQSWPLYLDSSGEYYRWLPKDGPTIQIAADIATVSIATASVVRSGAPISGTLSTNLPGASWSVAATPSDMVVAVNGNTFSAVAPSVENKRTYSVVATAALGSYTTQDSATVTVAPQLTIGGVSNISGNIGATLPDTHAASTSGLVGAADYSLLQAGNNLSLATTCPGLSFDTSTAIITGTPSAACIIQNASVSVRDAFDGKYATSPAFTISMSSTQAPSGTYTPDANVGIAYSSSIPAPSGGVTPYTWSLASGSLPAGLSINSASGTIAGTPTATGTSTFTVKVTDANGIPSPASAEQTILVATPPAAPTGTLPNTQAGTAYSAAMSGSGGKKPYSWAVASGALPGGLTLDATTGSVSGTPNALGSFTFALRYTDATGLESPASSSQTIMVSAATASASLGTPVTVHPGKPIRGSLTTSITSPTWSFAVLPSTPVMSLTADSASSFTGTAPTVQSQTQFTITPTATEPSGLYSKPAASVSVTVKPALAYTSQPSGTYSANVNVQLTPTTQPAVANLIGSASYQLLQNGSIIANAGNNLGGLCTGLVFNATGANAGQITGTGSGACNVPNLVVRTADSNDGTYIDSTSFTVAIVGPMSLSGIPSAGTAGQAYSFTPIVTGGLPPYSFARSGSGNPTLVALGVTDFDFQTGRISGTPTAGGQATQTIQVTDSTGATKSTSFSFSINPSAARPLTITSPALNLTTYNGAQIYYAWTATGGKMPYAWTTNLGTGTVIAGETFDTGGLLAPPYSWYTAGPPGNYPFTVKVTDAGGTSVSQANQITLTSTSGVTPPYADGTVMNLTPGQSPNWSFSWKTVATAPTMTTTGLTGTGLVQDSSSNSPWTISGTISNNYGSYPIQVTFKFPSGPTLTWNYTLNIVHPLSDSGITRNLFVNGVQATSGSGASEYAWTSSQTVQNPGDSIELVYSKPVASTMMVIRGAFNPSTMAQNNSTWEVFYGDGTTYTSCGTYTSYGTSSGANASRAQCSDGGHIATNWKAVLKATQVTMTSIQASNAGYFQ